MDTDGSGAEKNEHNTILGAFRLRFFYLSMLPPNRFAQPLLKVSVNSRRPTICVA